MANRPLPDEVMQELESEISKKDLSADNNVSEIDSAIQKEEDRKLWLRDIESREKNTAELHFFNTQVYPLMKDYEGLTLNINPKKLRDDITGELQPIPKELADRFLLYTKDAISYLKSLDTHIRISELWGIIFGLSLLWQTLFFTAVIYLNIYLLHSSKLSSVILIFGIAWILSVGIWIYLWRKFKKK